MPDFPPEDLQSIRREQNELRLRLVALDLKIDALTAPREVAIPLAASAPILVAEKTEARPKLPPPLPPSTLPPPPFVADFQPAEKTAPLPPKPSWEFQLGSVWLVRIGIVILLTGLVFLGNYAYRHIVPHLGPWVKLLVLYILGGGLAWIGVRLEKGAESLRNYGRVLLSGGAALIYYTTYGATFVDKLRVIGSPLVGGVFLLLVGAVVVWLAEKRKAQSVALMAILLSYYTAAINPVGLFSLYSSLLLTGAAVYFLLRHRWTTISFLSLVGTYGSYAFWRFYRNDQIPDFTSKLPSQVWLGAAFLAGYWILFTVAVFLSRASGFTPERRTPFLTINNGAFFGLVFQILHANYPALEGRFCIVFGLLLLALSWLAKRREMEDFLLDGAYLIQGLAIITFGLITELSGYHLTLALTIQGTLMLFSVNRRHGWIYEVGAAITTLLALAIDLTNGQQYPYAELVAWVLVCLLITDAWLVKHFKKSAQATGFSWLAAGYSLLAVMKLGFVLSVYTEAPMLPFYSCLATVGLLTTGYFLKLKELAIVGQILALLASLQYIFGLEPAMSPLVLASITITPLLLLHWWQMRKDDDFYDLGQSLFSLVFLAVSSRWITLHWENNHFAITLGLFAVLILLYGTFTRAIILALAGQIIILAVSGLFFYDALLQSDGRFWPTLLLAVVVLDLVLLNVLSSRFSGTALSCLKIIQRILGALVFAMLVIWGWSYVAVGYRMLYFVSWAMALLLLADWSRKTKPKNVMPLVFYSATFAVLGVLVFWNDLIQGSPAFWVHCVSLLMLGIGERILKYRFTTVQLLKPARSALILLAISGLWIEFNRAIDMNGSHFPKTLAWALLGTLALAIGLLVRERTYRISGLVLLAFAIIHIFVADIWGLDPIFRIISFLVLGVVLLALGFVYNKFADKLKDWL